jgi:hypothetical protein
MKVSRRFGETCRLHLHGRKISQAINQREYEFGCVFRLTAPGVRVAMGTASFPKQKSNL